MKTRLTGIGLGVAVDVAHCERSPPLPESPFPFPKESPLSFPFPFPLPSPFGKELPLHATRRAAAKQNHRMERAIAKFEPVEKRTVRVRIACDSRAKLRSSWALEAPGHGLADPMCYAARMSETARRGIGQAFAHDGVFWRRMASLGAQRLPKWWVRYSPPLFGALAAVALPAARHTVRKNLRRIRGPRPLWRDVIDTTQTFTTYAGCLAETLAIGSKNQVSPEVDVYGREHMHAAVAENRGVILLTMHTGGWEVAGPILAEHTQLDVVVVMEGERDERARALHDRAREHAGVRLIHVGPDPLAALPLVRHLTDRHGAAAMQIDRVPPSGRVVHVKLLDHDGVLPEGPFRLAQLTGAPLIAVFCARTGFRQYTFHAHRARHLPRRPTSAELGAIAQGVADDMTKFLREHPTQWFEFGETKK